MHRVFRRKNRTVLQRLSNFVTAIIAFTIFAAVALTPQQVSAQVRSLIQHPNEHTSISLSSSLEMAAGKTALANVSVLSSETLSGTLNTSTNKITLNYSGGGLLNIGLLDHPYIIFQMPSEFAGLLKNPNFKASLVAKYDLPVISILNQEIGRNVNTFSNIVVDAKTNTVSMDFDRLLTVNLLSSSTYKFPLEIDLDKLPPAKDGAYTFYASVRQAIIDLSLLDDKPAPLTMKVPVQSTTNPAPKPKPTPTPTPSPKQPNPPDTNQGGGADPNKEVKPNPELGKGTAKDIDAVDKSKDNKAVDEGANQNKNDKQKAEGEQAVDAISGGQKESSGLDTVKDFIGISLITLATILLGFLTRAFNGKMG